MSVEQPDIQAVIDVVIGPCSRERAVGAALLVQEYCDAALPDLQVAVGVHFDIDKFAIGKLVR